jgi:hypothetical protein
LHRSGRNHGFSLPPDRIMWEKKIKPIFCAFYFPLLHFPV